MRTFSAYPYLTLSLSGIYFDCNYNRLIDFYRLSNLFRLFKARKPFRDIKKKIGSPIIQSDPLLITPPGIPCSCYLLFILSSTKPVLSVRLLYPIYIPSLMAALRGNIGFRTIIAVKQRRVRPVTTWVTALECQLL